MINIKDVSYKYAGNESKDSGLKNINLSIKEGECVLLCGKSGCGKTSVTRLINGLIPEYFPGEIRGEVTIDKKDIDKMKMYEISEKVGSVFQNPKTQFFNVDVDSEIVFGMENQAMPANDIRKRLRQVIKELSIEKLTGRSIFELSGGEKQKTAFASVYGMNPEVYFLDEPSSNLDMKTIQELRRYLFAVKQQGKTIVIAEHRLHYLMDIVDRIIYLEKGKIQTELTAKELYNLPQKQRMEMGLRAVSMKEVHPLADNVRRGTKEQLEMKGVTLFQNKRMILTGLSFRASEGEIIAVTGHNGTGKTTFLRMLCGLHKEYTGKVLADGKIQNDRTRQKESYLVMQDVNYELFADSVKAECTFGIKNPDEQLVDKTLSRLGLLEYREKHPNTLSGGQKQRVAVAVSMICRKRLLAFDEPTSGLDFDSMRQVVELLKDLSRDKIIFVVTHDYEFICQACSRILHFKDTDLGMDIPVNIQNEDKIKQAIGLLE